MEKWGSEKQSPFQFFVREEEEEKKKKKKEKRAMKCMQVNGCSPIITELLS